MTSMVGFIYRMFKEYEVDEKFRCFIDERRIDDRFLDKTSTESFDVARIEGMMTKIKSHLSDYFK